MFFGNCLNGIGCVISKSHEQKGGGANGRVTRRNVQNIKLGLLTDINISH